MTFYCEEHQCAGTNICPKCADRDKITPDVAAYWQNKGVEAERERAAKLLQYEWDFLTLTKPNSETLDVLKALLVFIKAPDTATHISNKPEGFRSIETSDETMQENAKELEDLVVGHRIVAAHVMSRKTKGFNPGYPSDEWFEIVLDNNKRVKLIDSSDCCAYTDLKDFLLNPQDLNHVITGVSTEEGFTKWHIYSDAINVLSLDVEWSEGNPYFYGYGFDIEVEDIG